MRTTPSRTSSPTIPSFLAHITVYLALLGLIVIGSAGPGWGQTAPDSSLEADAEALTDSMIVASSDYQNADPPERTKKLNRLLAVAQKREARLLRLMEKNTKKFLKLAMPKKLRDAMPASVKPEVEEETEVEGTVQVLHEDHRSMSFYRYSLQAPDGELAMHFAAAAPVIQTGARIKVKGMRLKKAMAVGADKNNVQPLALPAPLISGAQSTAVILVNFTDKTSQPYTLDQIKQLVFTTTSDFNKENSYQQTWLNGDVFGWYTIAMSSGVCNYDKLGKQARAAATAAGANLSGYKRYVYIFPQNACQWWGLGTIGGNPSHAWINGNVQMRVVAHEMGHNFGLYHSHALECGNATIGAGCQNIEYGDTVDVMGSAAGHFNAYQKERLGWLNSIGTPPITTALSGGQYLLDAYETPGTTPKALKIFKSNDGGGKKTWYYLEYRRPIGFDSFLSTNNNVRNGIVIHIASETSPDSSYLLDMTPNTSSWYDPALTPQQTYQDQEAGVGISVAWLTGTAAAVNVNLGPQSCGRASPALSVAPAQGVVTQAGVTAVYTLTVTNKDNAGCTASDFSITTNPPSGWTAGSATPSLNLNPGATASTTVQVTSPSSATDGSYDTGLVVTNSMDSSQSSTTSVRDIIATVCKRGKPLVTVSPESSGSLQAGTPFTYTVSVLNTDSSGCGASPFTFMVSVPIKVSATVADAALSVGPGTTGSTTVTVTSTPTTSIRSYIVNVSATNNASGKTQADKGTTYVIGWK